MKRYKILGVAIIIVVLLNIFPRFEKGVINTNDETSLLIENTLDIDINDPYPSLYNMEITSNGSYLISHTNDNFFCYNYNEVCENGNYATSASKISYFDEDFNEIWSLGGYFAIDIDILYDNHHFISYAVTELKNGNIISFGKTANLENNIMNLSLLLIDSQGEVIGYEYIDIFSYDYSSSGSHGFYEIVNTDDGGFTIKYTSLFEGSVIVHFNSSMEEQWFTRMDDEPEEFRQYGYYAGYHLDTMKYIDNSYYVLSKRNIINYNSDGEVVWEKEYALTITGFDVTEDSNIMITGKKYFPITSTDIFIDITDLGYNARTFKTIKLDSTNGDIILESEYNYRELYYPYYLVRHTLEDSSGNYYNIAYEKDFKDEKDVYAFYIVKYDLNGNYVGESRVYGEYNEYDDFYSLDETYNKMDIIIEDDIIKIFTPTTSIYREIPLNDIEFIDDMPIKFDSSFYLDVVWFRTFLNIGVVMFSFGFAAFLILKQGIKEIIVMKDSKPKEEEEEKYWPFK